MLNHHFHRLYQILIDGINKIESYRTSLMENKAGDDAELNKKSLASLNSLIKVIQGELILFMILDEILILFPTFYLGIFICIRLIDSQLIQVFQLNMILQI